MKNDIKNIFTSKKTYFLIFILIIVSFLIYRNNIQKPIEVNTSKINKQKVLNTLTYSGEVISANEFNIAFPVTGKLTYYPAEEGIYINQRELVAKLDSYTDYISYQKALNTIEQTKDELAELKRKFEVDRSLFQDSEDIYNIQRSKLQKTLEQAQLEASRIASSLGNYTANANFAGTLVDKYYQTGEVVPAGTVIGKIADLSNVYFKVDIDIEDIKKVQLGQKVLITLDSEDDKELEGSVSEISNIAKDDASGNKTVEVKIYIQDYKLILGEEGDAKIVLKEKDNVLAIPYNAIVNENNKTYVYVVDNTNKVKKVMVKTGIEGDLVYESLEGLNEGDIVILDPDEGIKEGVLVKASN